MREIVGQIDIREFGYFGDGINNDAPAFRAALAAMANFGSSKGAALVIPPSTAFLPAGETITIPAPMDGLTILGCGASTIIKIGVNNPAVSQTAFIVEDGSDAFFAGLVFEGPAAVGGGVTILAIDKQGTTGTVYLDGVDAINPANAGVQVAAGCRLEIGDCAEVGDDFTTPQGAPITYTALGDSLWGGTASHQPRQIKGELDPSAGGGVAAPQGSIYQRYNATGQLWLKTGAAATAWSNVDSGPLPTTETLQDAYNAGGAGPQYIIEDGTRLGVIIRDANPSLGALATLFGVDDNAAAQVYFAVNPSHVSSGVNGFRSDSGLVKGFLDALGEAGIAQNNAGPALPDVTLFGGPTNPLTQSVGMASALALNSTRTDFVLWASGGLGGGFGTRTAGNLFQVIDGASTVKFQVDHLGSALVPQQAQSAGSPAATLAISPGTHLALTASAQWSAVTVTGRTETWATGNITSEAWVLVGAPTLAFAGASTVSIASALDVSAPIAGANATLTGTYGVTSHGAMRVGSSTGQDYGSTLGQANYVAIANTTTLGGGYFLQHDTGNVAMGMYQPALFSNLILGTFTGSGTNVQIQADGSRISLLQAQGIFITPIAGNYTGFGPSISYTDPTTTEFAGFERQSIFFDLSSTHTFGTGALATQRAYEIAAPTYAFVGASTLSTAATFAVTGAPIAGTNATITTSYAIWAQAGLSAFDGGVEMANASPAVSASNTGRLIYNSGTQTFQVSLNGAAYASLSTGGGSETLQQAYTAGGGGTAGTITATAAGGQFSWTAGAASSGATTDFTFVGAAHTNQTLSTEVVFVNWNLAQTVQWATGNFATERVWRVQAPTLSAVGASTITTAATFEISGPPAAGTNMTITNAYPLWIESGRILINTSATSGWVTSGATFNDGMYVNHSAQSSAVILNGAGGEVVFFSGSDPLGQNHAGLAMVGTTTDFRMYSNGAVRWNWVASSGAYTSQNTNAVIVSGDGSSASYSYGFTGGDGIFRTSGGGVSFGIGGTSTISAWNSHGNQSATPTASTSGAPIAYTLTDPANTGITTTVEVPSVKYDLSSTKQWASGNFANQRQFQILAPTLSATAATTITNASTFYVSAAPSAGTNMTLTNKWSAWFGATIRVDSAQALGGGATATLGTVGGSGPATAAQNEWIQVDSQNGKRFVPAWA